MAAAAQTAADRALAEEFAEKATARARMVSGDPSLLYSGPNQRGFFEFHCCLPGRDDDRHGWTGTPSAWVRAHSGRLQAGCRKCSSSKADAAYLETLKAAIGWVDDNIARPEFGQATYRHHTYETADGRWSVRRTKVTPTDRRKRVEWTWSIADQAAGAFGGYGTFTPSEFCAQHYPELKNFTLALKLYGADRFGAVAAYRPVVLEGERDCDTFNGLLAAAGETGLIGTCLPHQTPSTLAAQQRAPFEGRDVVLIGDADEGGKRHNAAWGAVLWDVAASIRIFPPELLGLTGGGKDLSDATEQQRAAGQSDAAIGKRLIEAIAGLPVVEESMAKVDWRAALVPTKEGGPKMDSIANAETVLTLHPELAGNIRRDIRQGEPEIVDPPWGAAVRGTRAVANATSAWLERTEKFSPTVKALEAALNFEAVAPAFNPFEELAQLTGDAAELDELFIKHVPLAESRMVAVKAARTFWADFAAKLRGELVPQRVLIGVATESPFDLAPRLAGPRGLIHSGSLSYGHLLGFARQGVVLVQVGLDAIYNQRTAPGNLAVMFAPHAFNITTQRRCPTPMFIAVGAAPSDPRTTARADERVITINLEA